MPARFRLREALEAAGITQVEAAERAGLSFATVNRMCSHPARSETLAVLDRLARVLHIEPNDLITRAPMAPNIQPKRGRPAKKKTTKPTTPRVGNLRHKDTALAVSTPETD